MTGNKDKRAGLKKAAMALLGLGLSACGLAYVFRDILFGDAQLASRLSEIVGSFQTRARILPLLASVAIYWMLLIVLRSILVKHLLSKVASISVSRTYRHICIGFLANNVFPFRAGEMARSAAISKGSGIPFASVVGGLAVERMLDMAMLVLIALGALQVAPLPSSVRNVAIVLGAVLAVGFAVLIYTIYLAIQAYQGEWVTIPFITDFCKNQGWI